VPLGAHSLGLRYFGNVCEIIGNGKVTFKDDANIACASVDVIMCDQKEIERDVSLGRNVLMIKVFSLTPTLRKLLLVGGCPKLVAAHVRCHTLTMLMCDVTP